MMIPTIMTLWKSKLRCVFVKDQIIMVHALCAPLLCEGSFYVSLLFVVLVPRDGADARALFKKDNDVIKVAVGRYFYAFALLVSLQVWPLKDLLFRGRSTSRLVMGHFSSLRNECTRPCVARTQIRTDIDHPVVALHQGCQCCPTFYCRFPLVFEGDAETPEVERSDRFLGLT